MEPNTTNTNGTEKSNKKGLMTGLAVLVVLVAGAFGISKLSNKDKTNTDTTVPTDGGSTTETTGGGKTTVAPSYKDGTYSATGNYTSPGGAESVAVTLTLKDGVVVDAQTVAQATRPESKKFQSQFVAGFKEFVVGKNIDSVSITKVSGSSLTPKGFNDAVAKIKAEAKS